MIRARVRAIVKVERPSPPWHPSLVPRTTLPRAKPAAAIGVTSTELLRSYY